MRSSRRGAQGVMLAGAAAVLIILVDQVGKTLVTASGPPHQPTLVWTGRLGLGWVLHVRPWHTRDFGAALLAIVPLLAPIVRWPALASRQRVAAALLSGGAIGGVIANSAERMAQGHVTDWILVRVAGRTLALNLADTAIAIGMVAVLGTALTLAAGQLRRPAAAPPDRGRVVARSA